MCWNCDSDWLDSVWDIASQSQKLGHVYSSRYVYSAKYGTQWGSSTKYQYNMDNFSMFSYCIMTNVYNVEFPWHNPIYTYLQAFPKLGEPRTSMVQSKT